MTDKNEDILLRDFFSQASNTEIADTGFSHRVMKNIDNISQRRRRIASRIWTAICIIAAIVLTPWGQAAESVKNGMTLILGKSYMLTENAILYACHDQTLMLWIVAMPLAASLAVAAWCLKEFR